MAIKAKYKVYNASNSSWEEYKFSAYDSERLGGKLPSEFALKNSDNNFTAKNTFNDELIINDVENFNSVYLKKVLGLCNVTTTYANLPEEIKNGGYHRVWKISFPTGVNFWGKIKIHLYGGYSSFNASGKMAKEINVNFNGASMYSNVGYYTELSGFVEKDFRISEAIWNSETSQWEFWIYSDRLNGNNAPFIYVEGWARGTSYINSFKGLTLNTTAEFRQDTTYQNVKGNSAGQTLTKNWGDLPTYQNPYGQTIATIDNITNLTASDVGAVPTTRTVNGKALSNNISLTASDVGALPSTGTAVDSSKLNGQLPSYYLNYNNLTNKPTIPTVPSYSTQAQAEAGTSTTGIMSPLRVKQAIAKFAAPIGDYALRSELPTIPSVIVSNGAAETGKYIKSISASGHTITVVKDTLPSGGGGSGGDLVKIYEGTTFTANFSDGFEAIADGQCVTYFICANAIKGSTGLSSLSGRLTGYPVNSTNLDLGNFAIVTIFRDHYTLYLKALVNHSSSNMYAYTRNQTHTGSYTAGYFTVTTSATSGVLTVWKLKR